MSLSSRLEWIPTAKKIAAPTVPLTVGQVPTPIQLEAVIAHELCHIRRRDNLFAAIHMLIEALFWFDPLLWWVGARLVEERERACDEEVLQLGNAPQIYAESILKTCQFYLESPLACVSGVTGSDLKKRIVGGIMMQSAAQKLNLNKTLARQCCHISHRPTHRLGLLKATPHPCPIIRIRRTTPNIRSGLYQTRQIQQPGNVDRRPAREVLDARHHRKRPHPKRLRASRFSDLRRTKLDQLGKV